MMATPPASWRGRSWSFLTIVVGGGFVDLGAKLLDAAFDVSFERPRAVDDGGHVLSTVTRLARRDRTMNAFEFHAGFFHNGGATVRTAMSSTWLSDDRRSRVALRRTR